MPGYQFGGEPTACSTRRRSRADSTIIAVTAYGTVSHRDYFGVGDGPNSATLPPAAGDVANPDRSEQWRCTRAAPLPPMPMPLPGSFAAALSKAQRGDTVPGRATGNELHIRAGGATWPAAITIRPPRATPSPSKSQAPIARLAEHSRHVTFKNIGFGHNNAGTHAEPADRRSRSVTLVNASGRRFFMFEGNADFIWVATGAGTESG